VLYDQPTGRLALVFELMDMNIYELIRGRRHYLPEPKVKAYMFQLLKSMDHMHRNGIFHRDIKVCAGLAAMLGAASIGAGSRRTALLRCRDCKGGGGGGGGRARPRATHRRQCSQDRSSSLSITRPKLDRPLLPWLLHNIAITNIVWCTAYKSRVGGGARLAQ